MDIEYVGHYHELDHKMASLLSFIPQEVLTYRFETSIPEQGDMSFVDNSHGTLEKGNLQCMVKKCFTTPQAVVRVEKQRISNLHAIIILKTATSDLKSTTKPPFRADNVC